MAQERATPAQWDVLTAELRAYREQQKRTWGDLDNALIGRYLAGEVTPEERRDVEKALKDHPELRKLTDLVLDVLNEFEPAPLEKPAAQPRLLSFTQHRKARRPFLSRIRERGALVAAACLLLALGITLLRTPGPGPVTRTAEKRGPEFARVGDPRKGADLPADDFPLPPAKVSPASSGVESVDPPAPAVPPADIARVASWTERRLDALPPSGSLTRRFNPYALMSPARGGAAEVKPASGQFGGARDRNGRREEDLKRAVPILVQGLGQDAEPALQDRCGRALARVAPLARDAVPVLKKALEHSNSTRQQKAVVKVLRDMGPAANDAAPVLEQLALSGPADVRASAREALRCVFVGVSDQGQVLPPGARLRLNQRVGELSRRHNLHFSAQTFRHRPAAPVWTSARRVPAIEGRGLSVVICAEPPAVEVTLSPGLRAKGERLDAEALRSMIQDHLRKRTPEKGLEEAVELLERSLSNR